jgi:23S rRNA (cytidine1920-2'-O)/16S rRNA (cytidine1409-2'-O)-methyltransferase
VIALDVGHGQLHPRLRDDERVTVIERTNVRDATPDTIGGRVDAVVVDVSFISLTVIIPVLVSLCQPGSPMVLLVKPQFEAGRAEVSRGRGVISDPAIHDRVRATVAESLTANGCTVIGWTESPVRGGEGNREFLVHASTPMERA